MNRVTRLELALQILTAAFIIVAAGTLLWKPSLPAQEIPASVLNSGSPARLPVATIDPAAAQTIVDANIFSSSRSAPAGRYDPLESNSEATEPQGPEYTSGESSAAGDDETVPQLFGTVVGPGGASALMRLDPAAPGAQLFREGDRGGSYRVVRINEASVVLTGPQGQIVVRLIRPEGPTP